MEHYGGSLQFQEQSFGVDQRTVADGAWLENGTGLSDPGH